MGNVILHCDCNSFYASCELVFAPALRGLPMAVCGNTEERHGIVLAATPEAKRRGVRTAMVNWEALRLCPELVVLPPDYQRYIYFSKRLQTIYEQYTDRVEPFGLDECWLDISGPNTDLARGVAVASQLRERAKEELGLTLSVGVSFNKTYAKLGSDMKKPDATTLISEENYRQVVWPLPAEEMLGIGSRMLNKLRTRGITTIGDLAKHSPTYLYDWMGKMGVILQRMAAGEDNSPVLRAQDVPDVKSVGNSITAPRDMMTLDDVTCVLYIIADSVGTRLRELGLCGKCVSVMVRDADLHCYGAQQTIPFATANTKDIVPTALGIVRRKGFDALLPYRSIGVTISTLQMDTAPVQMDAWGNVAQRDKLHSLHQTIDHLLERFGDRAVERGLSLANPVFNTIIPRTEHIVHPLGFLR